MGGWEGGSGAAVETSSLLAATRPLSGLPPPFQGAASQAATTQARQPPLPLLLKSRPAGTAVGARDGAGRVGVGHQHPGRLARRRPRCPLQLWRRPHRLVLQGEEWEWGGWRWSWWWRRRWREEAGAGDDHRALPAQAGVPAARPPVEGAHLGEREKLDLSCQRVSYSSSCQPPSCCTTTDCRSSGLTGTPSKYSFAAHMGRLVRGVEGTGCHNFYPDCPFSNQDVLQIARRINFK